MILVGSLPAAHLHADLDHASGPVVHRHFGDGPAHEAGFETHASLNHDDHARAHFLPIAFVTTSKFSLRQTHLMHPMHPMHLTHPTHPTHRMHRMHLTHLVHPPHDPPLSFISSPAPPRAS